MAKKKNNASRPRSAGGGNAKQTREMRNLRITAAAVILFVLCLVGVRVIRSDWYLRHAVAVTVNGHKLTATDYNFYFYRAYYEYLNNADDSITGIGGKPDRNRPLAEQLLNEQPGEETTWLDYFNARAETLLRRTYYYYDLAQETGFELSGDQESDIDYDFQEKIWFEAEEIEKVGIDDYLENNYGRGMTEEIYRKNLRILFTANAYMETYAATLPIPEQELAEYYDEHADEYGIVTYRLFYLSGRADDEASQRDRMAEAGRLAGELAESATDEASFAALSEEYSRFNDELSYWEGGSRSYTEQIRFARSYFREWFAQPERKTGDTQTAQAANGWYVAMFLDRSDNDYPAVDLCYFTVTDKEAGEKAGEFVSLWREGEGTKESFFTLSGSLRDIDYSKPHQHVSSITYREQTLSDVPDGMRAWCFEEERAHGDVKVFPRDKDSVYVVYFDAYGRRASDVLAYTDLSRERFSREHAAAMESVKIEHAISYKRTQDK